MSTKTKKREVNLKHKKFKRQHQELQDFPTTNTKKPSSVPSKLSGLSQDQLMQISQTGNPSLKKKILYNSQFFCIFTGE